jgi:ATP-dependent helicase HrpB
VDALPIDALRDEALAAAARAPLVLSAPTGSGKSTQVPRWLDGEIVVVEPRRVACRSLAQRVAELEGTALGDAVGYRVRDEARRSDATRVTFVTPGIALRDRALLARADWVLLDEFHERRLDVDLLYGLLAARERGLVVMSATLDGDRIAAHLGGTHLAGQGRTHPIDVRYLGAGAALPTARDLDARVAAAVAQSRAHPGDVLVFLPGRGEIAACARALSDGRDRVLELHGGLSLADQSKVFRPVDGRKVVLATNVAETSLTLPGIGVVVDSGLVRRTRYHRGRGYLSLMPIALDSAEQRAGRAGRTGPGVALRLWSEAAILEKRTPPEVHRESLVPLLLGAAAAGTRISELRLLDPPKDYAVAAAAEELRALGALDGDGGLTEVGRELHAQPLDAPHARLLVEAKAAGPDRLGEVVDLVSVLAVGRPLFRGPPPPIGAAREDEDLREGGCDAVAAVQAVRVGDARRDGLHAFTLQEARRIRKRLRRAHGLPAVDEAPVDRRALAAVVLAADPRSAYLPRRRKRETAFNNGGHEVLLGRESAAQRRPDAEAILVLESRALGSGKRDVLVVATVVMPVPLGWLRDAGLGRERVARVRVVGGVAWAVLERVHAKAILETREMVPEGALAREAILRLILEGRVLKAGLTGARDRLQAQALARRLAGAGLAPATGLPAPQDLEDHLRARLDELGVVSGEDLALLSDADLWPPDLDPALREILDRDYPRAFEIGDASYEVDFDLSRRQVVCRMVRGSRTNAPPLGYLPRFPGFRLCVESKRAMHVVRER